MISAKSAHGKDYFANTLMKELHNYHQKVLITHFGDPVKWFAKEYFGYKGIKDSADRKILQYVGTQLLRTYNDTYWADIIGGFVAAISKENLYDFVLIPDLRFHSEYLTIYNYCKQEKTPLYTVRINRYDKNGLPYKNPLMTEEQLNHISECELDGFPMDFIIDNDGKPETIEQAAHTIMRQILPNYKEFDKHNNL